MPSPHEIALAREWAGVYRRMGYQPLPSSPDEKKPLCKFAQWWEATAPDDLFDRFPTSNIQCMTGRAWGLAVLDLDGAEAVAHVERRWPRLPRTWTVWHSRSGAESRHHWFRLPPGLPERRWTRLWGVWEGDGWRKRAGVELLVDRHLIMAPPSVHPKTGNPYGWADGCSPFDLIRPALLPDWLWRLPEVKAPAPAVADRQRALPRKVDPVPGRPVRADRDAVLAAIPDKAAVARGWGLRFARNPSESNGWVSVHDIDREDAHPSARFHPEFGLFWRPGRKPLGLFDLGVEMGIYSNWLDCKNALASEYVTHERLHRVRSA